MTEKRQEVIEKIMQSIPKMSDFEKGRLYGRAEAMEEENQKEKEARKLANEPA